MALRDHTSESGAALVPVTGAGGSNTSAQPYIPQWLRATDDHTLVLDRHRLWATVQYLVHPWHRIPRAIIYWTGKGFFGALGETRYVVRGGLRVVDGVYSWAAALHHEEAAKLALGSTHQYRGKDRHVNARTARGWLLLAALSAVAILGMWLGIKHPDWGILAGIGLAGVLDAYERHHTPRKEAPPHHPVALAHGMPTSVLRREVEIFLDEEGYARSISVGAVRFAAARCAYYIDLTCFAEPDPKLLRAMEKRIYAPDRGIRVYTDPANSAAKTLIVSTGNPLANVPEAPWIVAGTVSGWKPLDLGLSADPDCPFELVLVMRHILLVSTTRGGKTSHLSNIIDRLSATADTIVCGGCLVKSAVLDAWRSVLYKKAETVRQLADLLEWLLDEIQRRDRILKEINSDDDPDNDVDKWNPTLGPALVCVLDEWPEASEYDGTGVHKDDPNLLGMVKRIMRTGAGLGVSVILAVQASGNEDWGSSIMTKLAAVKIIGPCTEEDTVALLGKDKRNQGYAPHLLQPADEHNPNDAGMAVIDGPGFGFDYVRAYQPFKVKARALRREAEWAEFGNRPILPIESHTSPAAYIDAETVPPALALVDMALKAYQAQILSSKTVVSHGKGLGEEWTESSLAEALREEIPGNDKGAILAPRNGRCAVNKRVLRSYHRTDVDQAFAALEAAS